VDVDIELHSLLNDSYAQVKDMLARNRWGLDQGSSPGGLGASAQNTVAGANLHLKVFVSLEG
jgi:hypothetical protein